MAKLLLLLCSTGISLAIAEVGARLALPSRFYVWPPHTHRELDVAGEYLPGVWGPSSFTINGDGMRGDAFERPYRYRILAVGGSTTIGALLDDTEAWPRVVQEIANRKLGRGTVFVGNVGRPGHSTPMHVVQVEVLLDQYDEFDAVVLLCGVNDMLVHLGILRGSVAFAPAPDGGRRGALRAAFSVVPIELDGPWYARSALVAWIRTRLRRPEAGDWPVLDAAGSMIREQQGYRSRARRFVDDLPELSGALRSYAENLSRIIAAAEARGVRPILLTQPSMWRDGLSDDLERRLWLGGPNLDKARDGGDYLTARALAAAMAAYNRQMLDVCAARRVECIDLAAQLPRDGHVFVDDVHFTERGARSLAEILAGHLLETRPLSQWSPSVRDEARRAPGSG
ncbi:MAG: SGNH/GDSL hydrolase family protein [Myxococcota bacterium]